MTDAILHCTPGQVQAASQMLGRAFWHDPMSRRIIPDERRRQRALAALFGVSVRYGMADGEVYTVADTAGVAVWLPPGRTELVVTPATIWRSGMMSAFFRAGPGTCYHFLRYDRYGSRLHRQAVQGPHWYLMVLGVEPSRQGQGIGGALLQPVLARADAAGLPVYLETSNQRNLPFYRRHEFEVAAGGEALALPSGARASGAGAPGLGAPVPGAPGHGGQGPGAPVWGLLRRPSG